MASFKQGQGGGYFGRRGGGFRGPSIPGRSGGVTDKRFNRGRKELGLPFTGPDRFKGLGSLLDLARDIAVQSGLAADKRALDRPLQIPNAAAMVQAQLGEDQVVVVRAYGEDSFGNYTVFGVEEPGAPYMTDQDTHIGNSALLSGEDYRVVRAGPGNKGKPAQSCFAVPGGQGIRFTPLVPSQGSGKSFPKCPPLPSLLPTPPPLLKQTPLAEAGGWDSGKLLRDIHEGRGIDDPGMPERSRDNTDPAGTKDGRRFYA